VTEFIQGTVAEKDLEKGQVREASVGSPTATVLITLRAQEPGIDLDDAPILQDELDPGAIEIKLEGAGMAHEARRRESLL
jgi:hypothetical protein